MKESMMAIFKRFLWKLFLKRAWYEVKILKTPARCWWDGQSFKHNGEIHDPSEISLRVKRMGKNRK